MIDWIDPHTTLPGWHITTVLLKGTINVNVLNKYEYPLHDLEPADEYDGEYRAAIRLSVPFLCLATVRPWNGTVDRVKVASLILKWPSISCCDEDEYLADHLNFLRKNGMHRDNIPDYVFKRDLVVKWHHVDGWMAVDKETKW